MRISFKHDLHSETELQKSVYRGANNQDRYLCCGFPLVKITLRDLRIFVNTAVSKDTFNESRCIYNNCDWCAGDAKSHVYIGESADGTLKYHCGASALEIPDVKAKDIAEIKRLLNEEHIYLMKNEAGIESENLL